MSAIPEHLRQRVVLRAASRCEYCRLPQRGQVASFPIDHIIPRNEGGETTVENLALACPNCNGHKWAHASGIDPDSRVEVALFNPRAHVWAEHFRWSRQNRHQIEGLTAIGRATIARLRMNDPEMIAVRALLEAIGITFE